MLHLASSKPYTYAEVNIERLNFIYENATFENKEQQFLEVLRNEASAEKGSLASGLYHYQIALLLNRQGNTYQPKTKEDNQWKIKEALAVCESVLNELPDSRGAELCESLKSQILQKSLQITAERHIPINMPSRFLVNYKNLNGLNLTARRVTQRELIKLDELYEKDKKLVFIKKLPIAKEWDAVLKNEKRLPIAQHRN